MNIEDSRIIARFQCLLTESIVAKRLGQSRPDSKDALYQMLFEELEQRGYVLTLDIACFLQALTKRGHHRRVPVRRCAV